MLHIKGNAINNRQEADNYLGDHSPKWENHLIILPCVLLFLEMQWIIVRAPGWLSWLSVRL